MLGVWKRRRDLLKVGKVGGGEVGWGGRRKIASLVVFWFWLEGCAHAGPLRGKVEPRVFHEPPIALDSGRGGGWALGRPRTRCTRA